MHTPSFRYYDVIFHLFAFNTYMKQRPTRQISMWIGNPHKSYVCFSFFTGKTYFSYAPKQLFTAVIDAHADASAPLTFAIALPSSLYDGSRTYGWKFGNIRVQGSTSSDEMFTVTTTADQSDPLNFKFVISKVGGGAWTQTPTLIYEIVDARGKTLWTGMI